MPLTTGPTPTILREQVVGLLKPFASGGVDVLEWLGAQPPQALVRLDQRLRGWSVVHVDPALMIRESLLRWVEPSLRDAALFLASATRSGHARQQAVQLLPTLPGRLPLAAALLRCNDWVKPVRDAAQTSVMALLARCEPKDVNAVWPLVARLQHVDRVDREWTTTTLEPWLCAPAQRPLFELLLSHRDGLTRLHAYCLAFDQDPDWANPLRKRALHDGDPQVARLALRHVVAHAREEEIVALCRYALTAPSGQVRVSALRALAERQVEDLPAIVEAAVFDRAGTVRTLASWLRARMGQGPSVALWRDELDTGRRGLWRSALEGLADHAEPEDSARFHATLPRMGPRGKRTCLRGLIKAEGGASLTVLLASLENANAALKLSVARAQPLWPSELTPEVLGSIWQRRISGTAQARLLRRLHILPRWRHLELLLDYRPSDTDEQQWRAVLVDNWLFASDQYTPLGRERRQALLERARWGDHALDSSQAERVAQAIESA
jgi:hypothetical protein